MDTLIAALLRRLPDRLLEAVNTVSFNLLDRRGLIVWRGTEPRTQWRYFTVRRNTLPEPAGATTTATTRSRHLPVSTRLLLATTLALLLGSWLSRYVVRLQCPTVYMEPVPHSPNSTVDFSLPSNPESPSPSPLKPQPNSKPTPTKPGAPPSPH